MILIRHNMSFESVHPTLMVLKTMFPLRNTPTTNDTSSPDNHKHRNRILTPPKQENVTVTNPKHTDRTNKLRVVYA